MSEHHARISSVIRKMKAAGTYAGRVGSFTYHIYRMRDGGILLLVPEGDRWQSHQPLNIHDAVATAESIADKRLIRTETE